MNLPRVFPTAASFSLLLAATAARAEWLHVSLETADQVVAYDISLAASASAKASAPAAHAGYLGQPCS